MNLCSDCHLMHCQALNIDYYRNQSNMNVEIFIKTINSVPSKLSSRLMHLPLKQFYFACKTEQRTKNTNTPACTEVNINFKNNLLESDKVSKYN